MEYNIAIQGDVIIKLRDTIYHVSSSKLRQISKPLSDLIKKSNGLLTLNASEDIEAFTYFLKAAHDEFVPYTDITSPALTELARILGRYKVQPHTPPYDLVQFCFTRRILRPSKLSPSDLSRMLSVARTLGNTNVKQLLIQIFDRDNSHQVVESQVGEMQITCLLGKQS